MFITWTIWTLSHTLPKEVAFIFIYKMTMNNFVNNLMPALVLRQRKTGDLGSWCSTKTQRNSHGVGKVNAHWRLCISKYVIPIQSICTTRMFQTKSHNDAAFPCQQFYLHNFSR
uniref:Uncharacterized protein n=1 Tax=Cacopsylla melanoneura TaxID=428564 RepID=A0A8D8M4A0_9HEMI